MKRDLLSIAKRKYESVKGKALVLRQKISPLEKEMDRLNSVIRLLEPNKGSVISGDKLSVDFKDHPALQDPSVVDKIRVFLKGTTEGKTIQQMRDYTKLAWPLSQSIFERGIYNALVYLVISSEIEKFGQGSQSIYKPTSKLKEYVKTKE